LERTEMDVTIRPMLEGEIALIERLLPFDRVVAGQYYSYFSTQRAGQGVSLIAWNPEGRPVGHALIRWAGTRTEPMASALKNCPHLSALHVHPDFRSRGIGTQLLQTAEAMILERGYRQIGLSVDVTNMRAQALYTRLGYCDAGFPSCCKHWRYQGEGGILLEYEEVCRYLIKAL